MAARRGHLQHRRRARGRVTKVVTFGAFVEILDGVEGLVHISELAQHHVENPREIIQPGDPVRVKILEIDSERRRLSLSIKRVEGQVLPVRPIGRRRPRASARPRRHARAGPVRGGVRGRGDEAESRGRLPIRPRRRSPRTRRRTTRAAESEEPTALATDQPRSPTRLSAAEGWSAAAEPEAEPLSPSRRPLSRRAAAAEPDAPAAEDERRAAAAEPRRRRRARGARRRPAATRTRAVGGRTRPEGVAFVGLTGGIGAGKSTALEALERLGAAVLSTDRVVHDLYETEEVRSGHRSIRAAVAPDGGVDRAALATRAFATAEDRAWLEGLLWPRVGRG